MAGGTLCPFAKTAADGFTDDLPWRNAAQANAAGNLPRTGAVAQLVRAADS
jgi:hypothetical protein